MMRLNYDLLLSTHTIPTSTMSQLHLALEVKDAIRKVCIAFLHKVRQLLLSIIVEMIEVFVYLAHQPYAALVFIDKVLDHSFVLPLSLLT